MAYLALYRKYRPKNFSDLVGQNEIVNIIKNEILNNKLSHAYLFSGPRGTGKTSTAKIIARMINCDKLGDDGIPCGKCESCLHFSENSDIIEIDAASNNGVDEIRELRDKVNLVPTYGKYKVYIIDEVHMLTTQAFNALLKTLEEPPSHVIFILATTEFFKIPETIVSRCQKFQFSKFSLDDIVNRLQYISQQENINVSNEVLSEIARLSDGGLRDAINMLDQLSSFSDSGVDLEDVYRLNGVVSYIDFYHLLSYMNDCDCKEIIDFFEEIDRNGKDFGRFIEDFISFISEILVYSVVGSFRSNVPEKNELIKKISDFFSEKNLYNFILFLNDLFFKMKSSSFIKILVSTEFIKFSRLTLCDSNKSFKNNLQDNAESSNIIALEVKKLAERKQNDSISNEERIIRINNAFSSASKNNKEKFLEEWNDFKNYVVNNQKFLNIYSLLNDIEVLVVGDKNIIFLASYDSILLRLFENISIIEQALNDFYNNEYKIIFLSVEQWNNEKKKYISNIKKGIKYNYVSGESDTLESKCVYKKLNNSEIDDDVDKITSILGESVISFE
ncbi:MAG: DNA polymerase III subunit gamma/tau [Bacilli bacterium]|nr:DNA polymerase III subunit gamma/tau [Bacilli bacterium]